MTDTSNLDNKAQVIADWLSSTLDGISATAEYEIQDGGKFILFRAPETVVQISDKMLRALIYNELARRFLGIGVQWMLVFLDSKGDVIDEIDSIIGID